MQCRSSFRIARVPSYSVKKSGKNVVPQQYLNPDFWLRNLSRYRLLCRTCLKTGLSASNDPLTWTRQSRWPRSACSLGLAADCPRLRKGAGLLWNRPGSGGWFQAEFGQSGVPGADSDLPRTGPARKRHCPRQKAKSGSVLGRFRNYFVL